MLEIILYFLMLKTDLRLNLKVAVIFLHIDPDHWDHSNIQMNPVCRVHLNRRQKCPGHALNNGQEVL
jgi:hypothetical protein